MNREEQIRQASRDYSKLNAEAFVYIIILI